jgi:hypothetical protein
VRLPCGRRGESTCYAKRSKRKKTARSYAALRRAAYYPLSLPPYCKAFMAFLGFWQTASLRSAIVLLNWSPAQRCQRSTNPPVEAFFWEPTTGTIVLISEGPLPSRPEPICRSNTPGTSVWSGFRPDRFLVYFVLCETFQNWPGSKPITTRRFTCKWQDETRGVTQLVNGAWSSVSQR